MSQPAKQIRRITEAVLSGVLVSGTLATSCQYKTDTSPALTPNPAVYLNSDEIAATQAKVKASKHPNIYLDSGEIAAIKVKVAAGSEPWKTAYNKMIADANKALTAEPYSVTKNGGPNGGHDFSTEAPYNWNGKRRDGQVNPNADRKDYIEAINLGRSVRDLGLAYAFTKDSKYAEKAIDLIETWTVDPKTRMTPKFSDLSSKIELSITLPGMFYGADLIYDYPGWSAKEKNGFEAWVGTMAKNAKGWSTKNNLENWRTNFIASAGALLEDSSLLEYAFGRYKELIPIQIDSQGQMEQEIKRTKSLSYSLYAINAMLQTAEIARHYGVDLYNYTSSDSRGLQLALDYHAAYAANSNRWPHKQIAPLTKEDSVVLYELAYSYWPKPSYLKVINHWGRPMRERRILGPVSLTHANRFKLNLSTAVSLPVSSSEYKKNN